jgi:hypothetical protein
MIIYMNLILNKLLNCRKVAPFCMRLLKGISSQREHLERFQCRDQVKLRWSWHGSAWLSQAWSFWEHCVVRSSWVPGWHHFYQLCCCYNYYTFIASWMVICIAVYISTFMTIIWFQTCMVSACNPQPFLGNYV